MPNLDEMSRVLYGHHWETIEDWVENLHRLADLTDPEINELTRLGIPRTPRTDHTIRADQSLASADPITEVPLLAGISACALRKTHHGERSEAIQGRESVVHTGLPHLLRGFTMTISRVIRGIRLIAA